MLVLLAFAFVAGIVTVLSPCILPVLPVILASALDSSRWRPLGIVLGLVASFAFFTLALTALVSVFGISADALRLGGALVIGVFGLVILVPPLRHRFEVLVSRMSGAKALGTSGAGFWSGIVVGGSVGLIWAPCAGPILAAVTTLVATNRVSVGAAAITASFAVGAGLPMLLIAYGGRRIIGRIRLLNRHTALLQRAFGVVMVAFALTFFVGLDRSIQATLVQSVPLEWTNGLTAFESLPAVQDALDGLRGRDSGARPGAPASAAADQRTGRTRAQTSSLPDLGQAPEIRGIAGWVNGDPVTLDSLRGKVVLVDFWTYSCINCIRTLPYVHQWHDTYKDAGLVIVGVHTPEFEFEKSLTNVSHAAQQYGIAYPVALDNSYATWQAFNNHYWPAKYLIDARGHLRYRHFGEGEYMKTEASIRALLEEAGVAPGIADAASDEYSLASGRTPELYVGAQPQRVLASVGPVHVGTKQRFSIPPSLPRDRFALEGEWTVNPEEATAASGAGLDLHFYADDVYVVLAPGAKGDQVAVLMDGRPIGDVAGADVQNGTLVLDEPRMYHVVDLQGKPGEHRLSLRFRGGGTMVYAFTFG